MGGQFTERVALGLSREMLDELRIEAKKHGRTVLAQIRYFCEDGLRLSRKADSLESRLTSFEQRLHIAEEQLPYVRARTTSQKKTGAS